MSLSTLSIKRPVFAWMLMLGLIFFGWICFKRMGISQLPDVDFPVISISLTYDGAAPEVMESNVVDVIEDGVMTVEGIRTVTSYSRFGQATVTVEFELNRNIDAALQEVQTKVAQAQRKLPKDMDPPIITKTNPEDQPILWLTASSDSPDLKELMRYVRDHLKDRFTSVSGVGEVFMGGYVDPNLRVWLSNSSLNRYELTVDDVIGTINDQHAELPAGQIETSKKEYDVRTLGEAKSVDEFSKLVVNNRGGRPNYNPIYLKQVAKVEEGLAEIRRISRFNGQAAVGLGIRKQRGSNAVEVARAVKARMAEIQSSLPKGIHIGMNFDMTKFIEDSVGELNFTLILSAALTSIVCWLFLGSFSSTINVLLAIPTSIVGAFMVLYWMGFTLNTFTLLGLSLAIGIVVDDAIMVLENIVRYRESGKSRREAALLGSQEITSAAVAATIAIVAIFLPVAFMRGVIGKFFFQFGVTMTVTVLLSLLEALTLTPMRCAAFVEAPERTTWIGKKLDETIEWGTQAYTKTLKRFLEHPWKVIAGALVFFVLSMATLKGINKEFTPAQDQSAFLIRMETPLDSSMTYTDGVFRQAEEIIRGCPEVLRLYSAVGGFGGGEVNSGNLFVSMKDKGKRGINPILKHEATQQEFMDQIRARLKKELPAGTKVVIMDISMRGFTASRGFPIEFTVRGPDWDKLGEYSTKIRDEMAKSDLMTDVDTDYKLGKPEVHIIPDRMKSSLRGVSVRSISQAIQAMVGGLNIGKYEIDGRRNDIRVRLVPDERDQADQVGHIFVRNNRGELVRLSEVVSVETKPTLQQIARYDRERAISIFANVAAGKSQEKALAQIQEIGKRVLPEGYRIVLSGSAQTMKESFNDLMLALVLGIVVAYMVLGSQFNSFIDPITILLALPFSISGAFLALRLTGLSLNIFSFIGLILLMGIVKKNSILLVEFTHQVRARGTKDVKQALIEACPIRLRPILMTSTATIAGAIPPALAIGPGAETRVPMAVAVMGGVIVSTLLTLVVVPAAYLLFSKVEDKLVRWSGARIVEGADHG